MHFGAGSHDSGTWIEIDEELDQMFATEYLAQLRFAFVVLSVDMKAVFTKVDADEGRIQ